MDRAGAGASTTTRDEKTTDPEARAAVKRVLIELFDLPAVLRGRKPVSELAGLKPLFCFFALQFVEMVRSFTSFVTRLLSHFLLTFCLIICSISEQGISTV